MDSVIKSEMEANGYDVDGAIHRFSGNEVLYLTFLKRFPSNEHYDKIEKNLIDKNLIDKNYETAYKAAHALKGITGNLGLNPVYRLLEEMLSTMRNKESVVDFEEKLEGLYKQFQAEYEKSIKLIAKLG